VPGAHISQRVAFSQYWYHEHGVHRSDAGDGAMPPSCADTALRTARQSAHTNPPSAALILPGTQGAHAEAAKPGDTVPGTHFLHVFCFAKSWKNPWLQPVHT